MPIPLRRLLKDSFIAGVILVAPLAVTLFFFKVGYNWVVGAINPFIEASQLADYTANIALAAQLLAVLLILAAITLVGLVAQLSAGRRTLGSLGRVINFIPLFRAVYAGVRQVANSLTDRATSYEDVVFVEYPRMGVYSIGFITGDAPERLQELEGEDAFFVYSPSAPNPTGGALMMVPEANLHESDLTVREGLRYIMTTGMSGDPSEGDLSGMPMAELPEETTPE